VFEYAYEFTVTAEPLNVPGIIDISVFTGFLK
jgi:hypothetical protein